MNNDLISREALLKALEVTQYNDIDDLTRTEKLIDNALPVEITEEQAIDKLHETGWLPRHDKEMTERPQGEWVRKEDIIHYIGKQYSEHNELVPIWLSIGDMKGGAKMKGGAE